MAPLLLFALLLAVPPAAATDPVRAAFGRGSACMEQRLGRPDLADPYLAYVYPEETLASAPGSDGLTYRRVDAAILLALLGREGLPPGPLRMAADEARGRLVRAAGGWKRTGLAEPEGGSTGIALDTFCIVGWLTEDREMAEIAAAGRRGDHWLPEGFYDGDERFRRAADESWCLRLLAGARPALPLPPAVIGRIAATLAEDAAREPGGRGTFYEALHLGMALEQAPVSFAPYASASARALSAWAARHEAEGPESDSLPEWINLAAAQWLDREGETAMRRRSIDRVVSSQQPDGCWRLPGAAPPDYGSSFLTLRALLALAPQALSPAQ